MTKTGNFFRKVFCLLFLLSLVRLGFFIYNYNLFRYQDSFSVFLAFVSGLRFDLSFILTYQLLYFVLILFLPSGIQNSKWGFQILKALFIAPTLIVVGFSFADYEYIRITGTRLTIAGTAYKTDLWGQLPVLGQTYWGVPLAMFFVFLVLHLGYSKSWVQPSRFSVLKRLSAESAKLICFVFLCVVGIRGGFQGKVLHSAHAFDDGNIDLGLLKLNTLFHMVHTRSAQPFPHLPFQLTIQDSVQTLRSQLRDSTMIPLKASSNENVVLIILESFGTEYTKQGRGEKSLTPFLDTLAEKGFLFQNHYSSGRTSIEAIPALLGGVPSLQANAFIQSPYSLNRIERIGDYFKSRGYWTSFFHSGHRGTMFFNVSAFLVGIENEFAFEDYPHPKEDADGGWGIWDFKYLPYMADVLTDQNKPFFATVFTLSSHSPYFIHPDFKGKFPKGTVDIHESIGFSDEALKIFFEKASKQTWYDNTLFIITGDHTQENSESSFSHPNARYRVPLILYHPRKNFKPYLNPKKVTSHVDILPSLKDYFGFSQGQAQGTFFGDSVFNSDSQGFAVHGGPSCYWMVWGVDTVFRFIPKNNNVEVFDFERDPFLKKPLAQIPESKKSGDLFFKSYLQYFNEGASMNSWLQPRR
jgi:phosphoglycerol transferase MdoB-like AlkP superfamily enzyme